MRSSDPEQTRSWVADLVRSGLLSTAQAYAEIRAVVAEDHPDLHADATASRWIREAEQAWCREAQTWPDQTDYDRLAAAFAGLERAGIAVLQGCADHWAAKAALESASTPRGIAWFTPPDVWHAIDAGMLEVNLWHADTANAAPGDGLLEEVLAAFAAHRLAAHFDEGRIEVSAHWQRRPGPGLEQARPTDQATQ